MPNALALKIDCAQAHCI